MDLVNVMNELTINASGEDGQYLKSTSAEIGGVATELVYVEYTEKILLILSQYQKIGTLLMVNKDEVDTPNGIKQIYTTKVVFGAAGEEQQVTARFLAEALNISKPLCVFVNLMSYDIETLRICRDLILELSAGKSE